MVSINVKNIKAVEQAFAKYGDDAVKEFAAVTRFQANTTEDTAKQLAPKNNSTLAQSINTTESDKGLTQDVGTNLPYAAYQEFGTGPKVQVPAEFSQLATKAKNLPKGTWQDGVKNIAEWLRKKGGDPKNASFVLWKILKNGLTPRPFMYPAYVKSRQTYYKDLKKSITKLNKKFNNG